VDYLPLYKEAVSELGSGSSTVLFRISLCSRASFTDSRPLRIVAFNNVGDDYDVTPLFVSLTAAMNLTDHEGVSAGEG
jgi:hypothetical protein